MRLPYQEPRIGNRRWIAWKLARIAHRIYDCDYYERIHITNPDGKVVFYADIAADLYGGGVSAMFGPVNFPEGWELHWDDDYDFWEDEMSGFYQLKGFPGNGYRVVEDLNGWHWVWSEVGEDDDIGEPFALESEAFDDAAKDWQDSGGFADNRLAGTLKARATSLRVVGR